MPQPLQLFGRSALFSHDHCYHLVAAVKEEAISDSVVDNQPVSVKEEALSGDSDGGVREPPAGAQLNYEAIKSEVEDELVLEDEIKREVFGALAGAFNPEIKNESMESDDFNRHFPAESSSEDSIDIETVKDELAVEDELKLDDEINSEVFGLASTSQWASDLAIKNEAIEDNDGDLNRHLPAESICEDSIDIEIVKDELVVEEEIKRAFCDFDLASKGVGDPAIKCETIDKPCYQYGSRDSVCHDHCYQLMEESMKNALEPNLPPVSVKEELLSDDSDGEVTEPSAGEQSYDESIKVDIETVMDELVVEDELVLEEEIKSEVFGFASESQSHHQPHVRDDLSNDSDCNRMFRANRIGGGHSRKTKIFKCRQCAEYFHTEGDIMSHLLLHQGEHLFACGECGKIFRQRESRDAHMRIHTGERPFVCRVCGESFSRRDNMKAHMRRHTGDLIKCSHCDKCFTQNSHLNSHMVIHSNERPFVCSVCSQAFKYRHSMKTHMRRHTGDLFKCSHCDKCFTQNSHLNSHMVIHSNERPFVCSVCGQTFKQGFTMKGHMRKHTGDHFKCSHCGKCFTLKGNLNVHMFIHTGERPFVCSVCGQTFRHGNSMKAHMRRHTGDLFKCSHCDKCFNQKGQLKTHMRKHTGDLFKCSHCDKCFTIKGHLNSHMVSHSNERPFVCSHCGQTFKQRCTLKAHMRKHTGDLLKCSHCDKCFNQKGNLNVHMFIHTGERPFVCSVCGQTFRHGSSMKAHMRRHTGDLIKCSLCDKCFTLKGHLKTHIMVIH